MMREIHLHYLSSISKYKEGIINSSNQSTITVSYHNRQLQIEHLINDSPIQKQLSIFNIILFDIVMGNKCCGPETNSQPKYRVLLISAYQQVQRELQQPLYDSIILILTKKGHVKTLCDHLSSHKHRIICSLDYVKKKVHHRVNLNNYSVIFHESIVSAYILQKLIKLSLQISDKILEKLNDDLKSTKNGQSINKKLHKQTQYFAVQQFKASCFSIFCEIVNQLKSCLQYAQKQAMLMKPIKNAFSMTILSLVTSIFQVTNHNTISTIIDKDTIKDILNILINIISFDGNDFHDAHETLKKTGQTKEQKKSVFTQNRTKQFAIKSYRNIIRYEQNTLINSLYFKDLIKNHLPLIIGDWVKKPKVPSINDMQRMEEGSGQPTEIEEILLLYFDSYFSGHESEQIYKQLMIIFDELKFNRQKIHPIQKLLFRSLENYDLRDQVIYRWFDYILDYLAQVQYQPQDYLQDIFSQHNFSNLKYAHHNILNHQNIKGCIQTLKEWVTQGIINVKNIMMYKGYKTLIALLLNLNLFNASLTKSIQTLLTAFIQQYPETYIQIIQTAYRIISKIRYPNTQTNKTSKNIQKYINELISITTQFQYFSVIPQSRTLPIVSSIFQNLFKPINYANLATKMKANQQLQCLITSFYSFFGRAAFQNDFNLAVIAEVFEFPLRYMVNIIRESQKVYQNMKEASKQEVGIVYDLTIAIIGLSEQKNKSQLHQGTQVVIGHRVQLIMFFREGLYCQMVQNVNKWYKLHELHDDKSSTVSKKSRFSRLKQSQSEIITPPSNGSSKQIKGPSDFYKEDNKTYMGMAMCQYFIVCSTVRKLIESINMLPDNHLSIIHLLVLVEACCKQVKSMAYKKDNKSKKKKNNQSHKKEEVINQIERYIEAIASEDKVEIIDDLKHPYKSNQPPDSRIPILDISYYIIENASVIIEMCDQIGPDNWVIAVNKVLGHTQDMPLKCKLFQKTNKKILNDATTSNNEEHQDLDEIRELKNQKIIFEGLKCYYQEYLDNQNRSVNESRTLNKNREEIQYSRSAETDNYNLSSISEDSSLNNFKGIVNIVRY